MKCDETQAQLSALIDAELDDAVAARVRDHLCDCVECARVERELRRLADAAAELPSLDPPPALWRSIEARLDEVAPAARRRKWWWADGPRGFRRVAVPAGAALVAAAAAALVLTLRPSPPRRADRPTLQPGEGFVLVAASDQIALRAEERLPDRVLLADAEKEFRLAEEHYVKAADRLAALIARERADRPFSPELAAAFDRNLKTIDEAILRCRELARGAPDDPWAHEVLYAAYQRKLRFLEDILRSRAGEQERR